MTSIRHRAGFRRARWVFGAAIAAAVIGSGVAYATVPDSSGVIHACYKIDGKGQLTGDGDLRLIDPSSTKPEAAACTKNEAALNWNQIGQTGPAGPQGP